ncbi:bifunctional hydroxymethylpyrimidine kinase/phosphomethylpyrimidine kinase [Corynebacterium freiburgense]|uniref:bifunctional hydroxymethylpyrimidine kinase/phosphomethylpyrimidine kinase n=1 Tax=Corynebacterium freiburgense TaxID=556548 RepID=UPI0004225AE9|nr:bifunctional hydroxymethylpyrimidine kinase/phosphomethylpyrimidine kinase [Corynebacterium freiburgense]WJZ02526.1 Hydroxymethylpyrimidine/phosphomethylpyrimidine kinase [Corynebacterium freiburgense]
MIVARPRILAIAGTDPSGGAGIHADLKSIMALGGYGMGVVTSIVAQNTHGVRHVHPLPPDWIREQLEVVSDDIEIDAVKIGMLGNLETIRVVREWLSGIQVPVVLDPVMVATSGHSLLREDAESQLIEFIHELGSGHREVLITPNIPELARLIDGEVAQTSDLAVLQAKRIIDGSSLAVLVKGGHLYGDTVRDVVVNRDGVFPFESPRVKTSCTHGTGCSLSSAMATAFVRTGRWDEALALVKPWLQAALEGASALHVGTGNGPIDHGAGIS